MVFGSVIKSLQSVNKYLAKGFALEIPTTSEQRSYIASVYAKFVEVVLFMNSQLRI